MEGARKKIVRLKRSGDFRRVREQGESFTGRWLVLGVWRPANPGAAETHQSQFGVVTSRKVGGAVIRNKVRRRIRHIQQACLPVVKGTFWCVTVARFRAASATFSELEAEWRKLARRAGVLA
ncbi:MAG: ribonuclease P protein component [Verrucomicrobia bacterium]|nr:ribonuclease P protein component [Verrucomicrobiota bacterium]